MRGILSEIFFVLMTIEKVKENQYLTRKDNRDNIKIYEARDMVAVGWNICIDEILKGGVVE